MVYKVKNVIERVSVVPAVSRFPQLKVLFPDKPWGDWGWHMFTELNSAVRTIYTGQGCLFKNAEEYPEYTSLASFLADQGNQSKLTWFINFEEYTENYSMVCEDMDPSTGPYGPFKADDHFYVPAGWGDSVLGLAKMGIRKVEQSTQVPNSWRGITWKGETINYSNTKTPPRLQVTVLEKLISAVPHENTLLSYLVEQNIITRSDAEDAAIEARQKNTNALEVLRSKKLVTNFDIATANAVKDYGVTEEIPPA